MSLVGILIAVLVICALIWGTRALTSAFGIGEPLSTVILVIVVILCLVFLLGQIGYGPSLKLY